MNLHHIINIQLEQIKEEHNSTGLVLHLIQ